MVSPVSDRCAYAGMVDHSDAQGRGVGRSLLAGIDVVGIWAMQSSVFLESTASLALHAKAGFRVVGTRERLGPPIKTAGAT